MRLGRVRVGTRFVFEDRGGIWEKISENMARCFFGKKEEYGTEAEVSPESFVFALFDKPEFRQDIRRAQTDGAGMKVIVVDEDDNLLLEIDDANATQVAAFVSIENIQLKPPKKRTFRNYVVMETHYRPVENALCVDVREDRVVGREEKDDEDDGPQGQAGFTAGAPTGGVGGATGATGVSETPVETGTVGPEPEKVDIDRSDGGRGTSSDVG